MNRQETAAHDLEDAARDMAAFIAACSDRDWTTATSSDGRSIASLAYHCAAGSDLALGWICQILSGRPVHETGDMHDAFNGAEASRSTGLSRGEATTMLHRTTERVAHYLRSLTDEELERQAMHGIADREVTIGQFIPNFGRHMRGHLQTMREAG